VEKKRRISATRRNRDWMSREESEGSRPSRASAPGRDDAKPSRSFRNASNSSAETASSAMMDRKLIPPPPQREQTDFKNPPSRGRALSPITEAKTPVTPRPSGEKDRIEFSISEEIFLEKQRRVRGFLSA